MACMFYCAGVPIIPIVSNAIFSKTSVNVGVANLTMSWMALAGACVGPFTVQYVPSKKIFYLGYGCSAVLLLIITLLFAVD